MRLASLLLIQLLFTSILFSQTVEIKNDGSIQKLVFAIDKEINSVEKLSKSPHYFSDNQFGVPAFSFLFEGKIQDISILSSQSSSLMVNQSKIVIEDQMLEGIKTDSERKLKEENPETNFPMFSINYLGNVNGRELTSIILRPWKLESGSMKLQNNIELKLNTQTIVKSVANESLLFRKISSKKTFGVSKISAGGFEKSESKSYRMIFKKTGIAKVGYSDILNFDGATNIGEADSKTIRVYNKGKEVPILMNDGGDNRFGEGDFIEFFCEPPLYNNSNPYKDLYTDPFTTENVYFLVFDNVLNSTNKSTRMTEYSGENSELILINDPRNFLNKSFKSKLHFEENRLTSYLGQVDTSLSYDTRDHQFWSAIGLNERKSFPVVIPGINSQSFIEPEIKLALHGLSYSEKSLFEFEHNVNVTLGNKVLNSIVSGKSSWNGQTLNIISYTTTNLFLSQAVGSGKTTLDIVNSDRFPNDAIARNFALNWIEVTYPRLYNAYENYLAFTPPPPEDQLISNSKVQFTLDEFTNPNIQIYKKGVGKIVNFSIESHTSNYTKGKTVFRAIFQDFIVNQNTTEYVALTESDKISPVRIENVYNSVLLDEPKSPSQRKLTLKNPERDESFIIISAAEFWSPEIAQSSFSPIREYAAYRESVLSERALENTDLQNRDNQTLITSIKDVYDEFNYGIKSPYAIRNFLDYAYHNWKKPPLYVLIIGDASNYFSALDLVPTMLMQTVNLGSAPSDSWYGMVEGNDIIPDIHIGRIPASKIDQLSNYLAKLKKYEADKDFSGWRNNSLFISGSDVSFLEDNNKIRKVMDKDYFTLNIRVDVLGSNDPFFGNSAELSDYWNNTGLLTVNFFGHGGGGVWDDQGLFAIKDIDALNKNSKLPFVTSMTCFTGNFTGGSDNLAEHLITSADKGAIGVLASSGVGWRLNDQFMADFLYQSIYNSEYRGVKSVGELVDIGKLLYRTRYNDYWTSPTRIPTSMIYQYNLIGDPAVILKYPKEKLTLDKPVQLLSSTDSIKVNISSLNIPTGQLSVKFADELNRDMPNTSPLLFNYDTGNKMLTVPIPDEVKSKNNSGNMKLYLSDQENDATGNVYFTFGKILINAVSLFPLPLGDGQYIKFKVQIDNKIPIKEANLTYRVIDEVTSDFEHVLQSGVLNLKDNLDGYWITQDSIPGKYVDKNYKIKYDIRLTDNDLFEYRKEGEYYLDSSPDISVIKTVSGVNIDNYFNRTIGFYDQNGVKLGAQINNNSNTDADNVKINFIQNGVSSNSPPALTNSAVIIGSTTLSIKKNSSAFAYIPIPQNFIQGNTYQIAVQAVLDTTNGKREQTTMNNLSWLVPVTFSLFLVPNTSASTVIDHSFFKATFASSFNSDATLKIVPVSYSLNGQDSLYKVQIKNTGNEAISITPFFAKSGLSFTNDFSMTVKLDESVNSETIQNSSLFKFEEKSQKWALVTNSVSNVADKTISAQINKFGIYKVFENRDVTPPHVSVSVNGRSLTDGNLVNKKANFSLIVQDENGLVPSKDYMKIKLDGTELDQISLNIPDTLPDGNQMVITFAKELSIGQHTLSYAFNGASYVSDLENNIVEKTFVVSDKQSVEFYGGFPNPFQDETVFSFKISALEINRVRLKIFTVSGQLINTFDTDQPSQNLSFIPTPGYSNFKNLLNGNNSESLGPGEYGIFWNGTDSNLNDVAYGVYYIKLMVDIPGEKTIEKIFKTVRAAK